jgi:C-terminal processing protease CtpA/Prc
MKPKHIILSVFFLAFLFLISCEEEKVEPPDDKQENGNGTDTIARLNQAFYNLMNNWYYWYEEIPEIDPDNYNSSDPMENLQNMLDDIRYEVKDRFSYITSYEAFQQYYQEGAYYGYGFGYKWDADENLRITFVFEDSPFADEGITRGWAITEVNGTPVGSPENYNLGQELGANKEGVNNTFKFKSPGGETLEASFTSKKITMNTVLMDTVINHSNKKVGYFVLKSFINKTPDELTETFRQFADKGIDELVVDLRYNGGGTLSASRFLGEFIINEDVVGEPYVKISHNDKRTDQDTTHVFGEDSLNISLGLNRTYFLTTQATASASESVINGLKPYFPNNVYTIGQNTYGKPVGMYAFFDNNKQYAFLPVTFKLVNANGNGEYFDGLPPDVNLNDDFNQPFGSMEDDLLYQALYHIENESFDMTKAAYRPRPENRVEYKSLRDEIGAL